jgi:hypothetical protein
VGNDLQIIFRRLANSQAELREEVRVLVESLATKSDLAALGEGVALGLQRLGEKLDDKLGDGRLDFTVETLTTHQNFIRTEFDSKCPCCRKIVILDADGRLKTSMGHKEHMRERRLRELEHTWLLCTDCHGKKSSGKDYDLVDASFRDYQLRLSRWLPQQLKLVQG